MSKSNLKEKLLRWLDPHYIDIDYPTTKKKNTKKKILLFFFFVIKLSLLIFLSLFLLLIIGPFNGIVLLILFTKVYLFKNKIYKKYKNIFYIWGVFFFTWYFVFIGCMFNFDGSILIRPHFFAVDEPLEIWGNAIGIFTKCDETSRLFLYVDHTHILGDPYYKFYNYRLYKIKLGNFCIHTLMLLSFLSCKLGVTIYVPSIFKGILFLVKAGKI